MTPSGKRTIPTVERTECSVCRRPVDLCRTVRTTALFEPGDPDSPHRCPDLAMIKWRQMLRFARMGDPRFARSKPGG